MTLASPLSEADVLGALPAPEEHSGPSPFYRVSLAVVAGLTILLPLLYVALVAAAAWGWWWWVQNGFEIAGGMDEGSGRSQRGRILLFMTPLIIGPLVILFLLKPLFARRGTRAEPWSLSPGEEPVLFALVHAVCDRQGAPRPSRIDLDMQVNASASFGRGVKAWFSNDLVLTLGMPLLTCLDVRQLTSVLSHEFGHFSQTIGMRAYFIIATINQWFARVVYERDAWDERLKRWSQSDALQIMLILMIARAGVWLSRLILKGLMHVSHLLAQSLSRQMEFDADGYSVRIVGPDVFAASMKRIVLADLAHTGAMHDLQESFKGGTLPDNLVALVAANLDQIPEAHTEQALEEAMTSTASMYASHPAMGVRIAHAASLGCTSTMDLTEPAQSLFSGWTGHCETLTHRYFETVLGEAYDPDSRLPWEEVNAAGNASVERRKARQEFFGSNFGFPMVLFPSAGNGAQVAVTTDVATARTRASAALTEIQPLYQRFWTLEDEVARGKGVLRLQRQKHTFSMSDWGFDGVKKDAVRQRVSDAQDEADRVFDELTLLTRDLAQRALTALDAVENGPAPDLDVGALEGEIAKLRRGIEAQRRLGAIAEPIAELDRRNRVNDHLFQELGRDERSSIGSPEEVGDAISDQAQRVRKVMEKLHSMAADALAPSFKNDHEPVTLNKRLLSEGLPRPQDVNGVVASSDRAVAIFVEDYELSLGLIAEGTLAIEDALGHDRIAPPTD